MSRFRNIVISSPCKLQYKGGYMVVRREDDTAKIHLSEVSSVVLQSNQVFVSAYLLSELAKARSHLSFRTKSVIPSGSIFRSMALTTPVSALLSRSNGASQ